MKIFLQVIIFSLTTFVVCSGKTWLYYEHYPWVWDNMSKDWLYLRGSSDGKIYAYRQSTKEWAEFEVDQTASTLFDPQSPPSTLNVDLNTTVNLEMIWVEPGSFMMGSPENEIGHTPRETQHLVTIDQGFYLGKYEFTEGQWDAVSTPPPYPGSENPNLPVSTNWDKANRVISNLNSQKVGQLNSGWAFDFPTEEQWEYACRAGTTTPFSFGNTLTQTQANFAYDGHGSGFQQKIEVGQYSPNQWGFYDMHGNVWEFCKDWAIEYPSVPANWSHRFDNPDYFTTYKILRGGCFETDLESTRSALRNWTVPEAGGGAIPQNGFRIALKKTN
jgi:formylglycine-generating enzyme required for sulfatase activity